MIKINAFALTGGMGTGKSTVLNFFKDNNFLIYDVDKIVNDLFKVEDIHYQDVAKLLDNWLGTNFVNNKEGIDKKKLRPILEKTEQGFQTSLKIVTPFVQERIQSIYLNSKEPIIFEIPLLFEANMQDYFAHIILITCNINQRIQRIKQRQSHLSEEQILQTINSQKNDDEKKSFCEIVIDNSGSTEDLIKKLDFILPLVKSNYSFF